MKAQLRLRSIKKVMCVVLRWRERSHSPWAAELYGIVDRKNFAKARWRDARKSKPGEGRGSRMMLLAARLAARDAAGMCWAVHTFTATVWKHALDWFYVLFTGHCIEILFASSLTSSRSYLK
jgi:hypothetical protein